MSKRGMEVSRDLFQAVASDPMSLEAFSFLGQACELIATPRSDRAENIYRILKSKERVLLLLRKRLETGEAATDQVIMTIFFLLTFDVSHWYRVHMLRVLRCALAAGEHQTFDAYLGCSPSSNLETSTNP